MAESGCQVCYKTQAELAKPLKHCAKCRTGFYCSRECQKVDFKEHKKICATQASNKKESKATSSSTRNVDVDKMITAMRETFDMALNKKSYKAGAFRGLVDGDTPPLDSLNILLASELVTEQEKMTAFRPWKAALTEVYDNDISKMDMFALLPLMVGVEKWCEVFTDDLRSRGAYVPSMMVQTLNDDGSIKETQTIDRDGNIQATAGGRYGEVPGALDEFNRTQAEQMKETGVNRAQGI